MNHPIAHTIFSLIQQLEPAAKDELLQLLNGTNNDAAELADVHVQAGGAMVVKQKDLFELGKIKKWSNDDLSQALAFFKLPANLIQHFTNKKML